MRHGRDEDERCSKRCGRTVEVSTVGNDPDRQGIGAGPGPGGTVSSRLFIPETPTVDQRTRYTFILCGTRIEEGERCHVLGYAQKLDIGFARAGAVPQHFDLNVTTPDWCFADGNVAWSIRFIPGIRKTANANAGPGMSPLNAGASKTTNPYGVASALLYSDNANQIYVPPGGGEFLGEPIESIMPGTWYDMRQPWTDFSETIDHVIDEPGDLIFQASVFQTDVRSRPAPIQNTNLAPEDMFGLLTGGVSETPNLPIYRYIAGRMLLRFE